MPRYKLTIEYTGTRYSGWQIQQNARTVQGEIDAAVREVTGRKDFELYGSGRTDAGVHALGQVAHLDVATSLPPESLRRKLNDELPADINILTAQVVPHRFHATARRRGASLPLPDGHPAHRLRQTVRLVGEGDTRASTRMRAGGAGLHRPARLRRLRASPTERRGELDPRAAGTARLRRRRLADSRRRRRLALPLADGASAGRRAGGRRPWRPGRRLQRRHCSRDAPNCRRS